MALKAARFANLFLVGVLTGNVFGSWTALHLGRAVPLISSFCTDAKAQFCKAYELDPYRCRYVPSVLKYLSCFT